MLKNSLLNRINWKKIREVETINETYVKSYQSFIEKIKENEEMD